MAPRWRISSNRVAARRQGACRIVRWALLHSLAMVVGWLCIASLAVAQPPSPRPSDEGLPSFSSIQRVRLVLRPLFSPYTRMVYTWSKQGRWMLSSTEAYWPPPLPKFSASTLMDHAQDRQWARAVRAIMQTHTTVACLEDPKTIKRGYARLRIYTYDDKEARCYRFHEDPAIVRWGDLLVALVDAAPAIPSTDRWSQPFWLADGSGLLRLELHGTAILHIDGHRYGRVNGVVSLRLRNGVHRLVLTPLGDGATQRVQADITSTHVTSIRVSMGDEKVGGTSPSWYSAPP